MNVRLFGDSERYNFIRVLAAGINRLAPYSIEVCFRFK